MRSITAILSSILLACSLAVFPIPTFAVPPPLLVQNCQKLNGGSGTQFYSIVIGSGGTTGCTHKFTPGDAIAIGYSKQAGGDLTTGAISATGATITWRKAGSTENSVFGPPGYWSGWLYACPPDITSPTSTITITVDMGASMQDMTSINGFEVTHVLASTSCEDTGLRHGSSTPTCATGANVITTGTASGTLAATQEFISAIGWGYGNTSCSTTPPPLITAGTAAGLTSFGNFTIPSNASGTCTATQFGETGCATFAEYIIVTSNTSGICYGGQTNPGLSGVLVSFGFQGGPGPNAQRPRFLED